MGSDFYFLTIALSEQAERVGSLILRFHVVGMLGHCELKWSRRIFFSERDRSAGSRLLS